METYHYIFRWLNKKDPTIVDEAEHIYAPSLQDARNQIREGWPELDVDSAMVERIKENGTSETLPGV